MKEIIKKLKFKNAGVVINAPATIEKELVKIGFSNSFDKKIKSTDTLVFVQNEKEYINFLNKQLKQVEPDSIFWIAYPKASSSIKTNINRDTIRISAETFGIQTVAIISIDDTWSALRFRPIEKVGK
jgi:hypothetical protein